jgi:hypothetical protein
MSTGAQDSVGNIFSHSLWANWFGDRIPVGARIFTFVLIASEAHQSSSLMFTGPGGKAAETGMWRSSPLLPPPPPGSTEVKEKVGPHFHARCVLWRVSLSTFPFILTVTSRAGTRFSRTFFRHCRQCVPSFLIHITCNEYEITTDRI